MAERVLLAVTSVRFSAQADLDLEDIYDYLCRIPERHAARIIGKLDQTAVSIGENPFIGTGESDLTRELGREVRSPLSGNYRIFYFVSRPVPEIFAIFHTSRDLRETLANRAQ